MNLVKVHILNLIAMKRLMKLVTDAVLVTIVTSSLAGSPKEYAPRIVYESVAATPEKYSLEDKANSKAITSSEIYSIVNRAFSKIKTPDYISLASQMARIYVESKNIPNSTSPVGARGLTQLMEESWYDVMNEDFENAYDPLKNIMASLEHINLVDIFLRQNYPEFDELSKNKKLDLMNAAYNGGQGRLMRAGWDINKMSKETRNYVKYMRERTSLESEKLFDMYSLHK